MVTRAVATADCHVGNSQLFKILDDRIYLSDAVGNPYIRVSLRNTRKVLEWIDIHFFYAAGVGVDDNSDFIHCRLLHMKYMFYFIEPPPPPQAGAAACNLQC